MPSVDFLFDTDCPNVPAARAQLVAAFAAIGAPPKWVEWDLSDPMTPEELRGWGSPTILVDGRDISGAARQSGARGCRIYSGAQGLSGVPSLELLVQALRAAPSYLSAASVMPLKGGWRQGLAVLPTLGLAAVPVGVCPICFAGYVGAFSSLGLGFLLEKRYFIPLAGLALLLALGALLWKAPQRRGYGPFVLGLTGGVALAAGQWVQTVPTLTFLGAAGLVIASLWNAWPLPGKACNACSHPPENLET
jgi:mercuric ion transport protein